MPRVKSSVQTRRRRKKILKMAKGYFGSKKTLYRTANEQVMRSLRYSYIGRKQRKRDFRKLWIQRINAACQLNNFKYSQLVYGLSLASVAINRKMLADMAVNDADGFKELINVAQNAIKAYPNGRKDLIKKVDAKPEATVKQVKVDVPKPVKKAETPAEPKAEEKPAAKPAKAKAEEKPAAKPAKAKVEEKPAAKKAKAKVEEKPLNLAELKVVDLKSLAKEKNIAGYQTMRKAELIEALKKIKE